MEATEFVALVRRMRAAQKAYYQHDGKKDPAGKQSKLISSKQLEADVDRAEVVFTLTVRGNDYASPFNRSNDEHTEL